MPKGSFIVAKTGVHPMKVKLRLFLDWGIRFRKPYEAVSYTHLDVYKRQARVSELADICMRDVRLDFPAVITLHGKGGKIRTVPLMKPTTELLRSCLLYTSRCV